MTKLNKFICIIMFTIGLFIVGIFDVNASSNSGSFAFTGVGANSCSSLNFSSNSYAQCFHNSINYDNLYMQFYTNYNFESPVNFSFIIRVSAHSVNSFAVTLNDYACDLYSFNESDDNNDLQYYLVSCNNFKGSGSDIFIRFVYSSLSFSNVIVYYPFHYSLNGITDLTDITNQVNEVNDTLNDSEIDTETSDSSTSGFSDTTNSSMSDTPVSSMIGLPITFLNGVNNALSSSCTNVNYIELFDYQLVLPCLNLSDRLGSVWTIIDTICSCMLIFSIGKSLVGTFARLSDMDTNIMYECYANGTKHRGEGFDD